MTIIAVESALERVRAGGLVLLLDSEDREDEGDLMVAAEHVTPEVVNFMIRQACGLVCMPCDGARLDELGMPPMVVDNTCAMSTAFTVSIDWRLGGSGISAHDRAATKALSALSGAFVFTHVPLETFLIVRPFVGWTCTGLGAGGVAWLWTRAHRVAGPAPATPAPVVALPRPVPLAIAA